VNKLIASLEETKGVDSIHNVHVWSVCSNVHVLDCHVYSSSCDVAGLERIKEELRKKAAKFGIRHTTFEFESRECALKARHRHIKH